MQVTAVRRGKGVLSRVRRGGKGKRGRIRSLLEKKTLSRKRSLSRKRRWACLLVVDRGISDGRREKQKEGRRESSKRVYG